MKMPTMPSSTIMGVIVAWFTYALFLDGIEQARQLARRPDVRVVGQFEERYLRVRASQSVRAKRLSRRIRFTLRTIPRGKRTTKTKPITAQLGTENGPNHRNIAAITAPTMMIRLPIRSPPVAGEDTSPDISP